MTGFVRLIRRIGGVLLVFVFVAYTSETHTDASGVRKEVRLGAWFSPWFTRTETTKESAAATPEGGSITSSDTSWSTTFTLASWSWPILAAGLALLFWPARKPPAEKTAATTPSSAG